MSDLRRLLRYVRPYRRRVALAIASMVGVSLCTGAYMAIVKFIFDDLLASKGEASVKFTEMLNRLGMSVPEDVRSNLVYILSAFVALTFLKSLFTYSSHYLMGRTGQHVVEDVRNDLYRAYQTQSLSFFHRHSTGNLISHLINDANRKPGVTTDAGLTNTHTVDDATFLRRIYLDLLPHDVHGVETLHEIGQAIMGQRGDHPGGG